MSVSEKIAVTGATGHLGRLVVAHLRKIAPQAHVIGIVRNPANAQDLAAQGVELRKASYTDPAALATALAGVDKLLLISSSEVGQRTAQHRNVVDAAKAAKVKLIGYTSILRADSSPMALAGEHRATEEYIRASGLPFVFLRNGWYTENYTAGASAALQHGAVMGSARDGRISSAARLDYAEAAANVLAQDAATQAGKTYELAGDESFTLSDYAAELARQSGKQVVYRDLPEAEYKAALVSIGLPEPFAEIYAESDAKAARGSLHDTSRTLSKLIGRPTTPLAATVAEALRK